MKCSQQCQNTRRTEGTKLLAQLSQDVKGVLNIKCSLSQHKCFIAECLMASLCMQAMVWTRR